MFGAQATEHCYLSGIHLIYFKIVQNLLLASRLHSHFYFQPYSWKRGQSSLSALSCTLMSLTNEYVYLKSTHLVSLAWLAC